MLLSSPTVNFRIKLNQTTPELDLSLEIVSIGGESNAYSVIYESFPVGGSFTLDQLLFFFGELVKLVDLLV